MKRHASKDKSNKVFSSINISLNIPKIWTINFITVNMNYLIWKLNNKKLRKEGKKRVFRSKNFKTHKVKFVFRRLKCVLSLCFFLHFL
jgi:hypothetical protein